VAALWIYTAWMAASSIAGLVFRNAAIAMATMASAMIAPRAGGFPEGQSRIRRPAQFCLGIAPVLPLRGLQTGMHCIS
jgi:hypothetical protein